MRIFFLSRLNFEGQDRVWDKHGGAVHQLGHIPGAKGVARGTFNAENGEYFPGFRLVNIFHFIGMHFDHPGHFNTFLRTHVEDIVSFADFALVHTHIG